MGIPGVVSGDEGGFPGVPGYADFVGEELLTPAQGYSIDLSTRVNLHHNGLCLHSCQGAWARCRMRHAHCMLILSTGSLLWSMQRSLLSVRDNAWITSVLSWWYWKGVLFLFHRYVIDRWGTAGRATAKGAVRTSAGGSVWFAPGVLVVPWPDISSRWSVSMLWASGIVGWLLGPSVPTQGSVVILAASVVIFFAQSQALVSGVGIATFSTPWECGKVTWMDGRCWCGQCSLLSHSP